MAAEKQKTGDVMIASLEQYRQKREELAKKFNVVDLPGSPMALAPLHAIGWEIVTVAPGNGQYDKSPDYYGVAGTGLKAPTKLLLNRIGKAAGVVWQRLQRVDDRRRPHARRFEAEGVVLFTDGMMFPLLDDKEVDLSGERNDPNTWSARVAQIMSQAERAEKPRDGWIQILQERATIDERAATGAKNRALRNGLGVADGYDRADIVRGFVVFRVFVTGEDEDPYIRREFKRAIIQARFGATAALYGRRAQESEELLPPPPSGPRALPPASREDDDGPDFDPETGEVTEGEFSESEQPSQSPAAAPAPVPAASPAPSPAPAVGPKRPARDPLVPHGKGVPRGPASKLDADKLDRLAKYLDDCAASNEDARKASYQRQDAADCREWAAYLRAGGTPF
jgi:hypothetical protein